MSRWDVFLAPAPTSASSLITNLTGHPAVVVPCGFAKGQPQAMVLIGRLNEEATPLRVALVLRGIVATKEIGALVIVLLTCSSNLLPQSKGRGHSISPVTR